MSMSVYVQGLRPVTEDYKKRLEIYNACKELNINPPEEILKYFNYESRPCEKGILIELPNDSVVYSTDMNRCSNYYYVDLTKLPEGVTKVRFEISY